jgi:hypothetical protein
VPPLDRNGGAGQTAGTGGAGGNAGAVAVNAKQTIASNANISAVGGNGGLGGSAGADGAITLVASGTISAGAGTLDAGVNSPTVSQNQSTIPSLAFCGGSPAPPPNPIPTLAAWATALMSLLLMLGGVWFARRGRLG